MLKNYFKIAWRNLVNNKVYAAINVAGLAIGMAVALLIALWIWDEVSFNKNFKNYDDVVKVMQTSTHGSDKSTYGAVPIPLAGDFRLRYPSDFKSLALTTWSYPHVIAYNDKKLSSQGMYVQPEFGTIFSLEMSNGPVSALADPGSVLLAQSIASTVFGNINPIDKLIKIDNKTTLKVAGIFRDMPVNSDFEDVKLLLPWSRLVIDEPWVKESETGWNDNNFQMFAQLNQHIELEKISAKVFNGLTGHERKDKPEVILHPMSKWHLNSDFKNGKNVGGNIKFVWMFGLTGFFVLLLACINFMNLSTARSEKRAKEVGIRKAIGSLKKQLIIQFLSESLLIAFISSIFSIILAQVSLPWFNGLSNKQVSILWGNGLFWLIIIGFTFVTGILSGSYPAFYLSSFRPIKVLKGSFKAGRFAGIPRKTLVVLQFSVSVSLIIGTLVVFKQIQYAKDRPVGYSREGVLSINMNTPELQTHYNAIRIDLLNTGFVANMGLSSMPATESWSSESGFTWEGKDPNLNPSLAVMSVSHDFGDAIGWQFKEGRDFSRTFGTDSAGFIINEAAVKYMGLKDPVGKTITYLYSPRADQRYKIVGVIKDAVMGSPYEPTKPLVVKLNYEQTSVITVRVKPEKTMEAALPVIAALFKKYNPGSPFEYKFIDDMYARKFGAEERIGKLATFFAIFAVFISCLGLFGLASFMAEQRTKELGVRKVLGASVLSLWRLLSKDFLQLVFISFFIAIPFSWYVMHNWLENYAYRTSIPAWIFIATCGTALLITLITVSFQAVKAALMNPVKSLRSE